MELSRLRQATFHSQMISPVVHRANLAFILHHVLTLAWWESLWPQRRSEGIMREEVEGPGRGSLETALMELPRALGVAGHASPALSEPASVPNNYQHDSLPALC